MPIGCGLFLFYYISCLLSRVDLFYCDVEALCCCHAVVVESGVEDFVGKTLLHAAGRDGETLL